MVFFRDIFAVVFALFALTQGPAFAQTKEIYAAAVFNNSTTYDQTVGGDGVALLSTAHPLPAGGSGTLTTIWVAVCDVISATGRVPKVTRR